MSKGVKGMASPLRSPARSPSRVENPIQDPPIEAPTYENLQSALSPNPPRQKRPVNAFG